MGYIVPILNKDTDEIRTYFRNKINEEHIQKQLVLTIVSIALLLDNMLYMVIVPIIPTYLRRINVYRTVQETNVIKFPNGTSYNETKLIYIGEDEALGYLFAIKAIVQLLVNPFSGTLIDRIGYEIPLIIGLIVMFMSTAIFALGRSYSMLFFARSLQGLGSAFADPSGLAMIADRFQEHERSKAIGIGLAFISFGSLVAPPFGGVLYKNSNFNHAVPFLLLAIICLLDGFMVFMVIKPNSRRNEFGEKVKGTPMWRLFLDPYIAVCSGALVVTNVSLAFLEPTIAVWMKEKMPNVGEDLQGLIWLPAFFPHVVGVFLTVVLVKKYPSYPWLVAIVGLLVEGLSCFFVPLCPNYIVLIIPLCVICFGIALVDTALLPMLGYLVDTRHVSVYGSVYAIADISYCLAYAFGPVIAGNVMASLGFFVLNLLICISNILYAPVLSLLRRVYVYKPFENVGELEFQQTYGTLDDTNSPSCNNILTNSNEYSYDQQQQPFGSHTLPSVTKESTSEKSKEKRKNRGHRQFKDTDKILIDEEN